MTETKIEKIPTNPLFGTGCFRRHIALHSPDEFSVHAAFEDDCHAFSLAMQHDGKLITRIEVFWERNPTSSCDDSKIAIKAIEGFPISNNPLALQQHFDAKTQCVHIYGVVNLAICQAFRVEKYWSYQTIIQDKDKEGRRKALLSCNNSPLLEWSLQDWTILAPEPFAGKHTLQGLTRWAAENLDKDTLEAALVLQGALIVAQTRNMDMNAIAGHPAIRTTANVGSCYARQPEQLKGAIRLSTQKDFSHCQPDPNRLLPPKKP